MKNENEEKQRIEEELTKLVYLIIESGYEYNTNNQMLITKTRSETIKEINAAIDNFCKTRNIDKKLAISIVRETIKADNELKHNKPERDRVIDLLEIDEETR